MPLTPGTFFGSFQIVSLLGTGGMGEVYRSRDTRLNRDVALKVLPDALAGDPDRLARFRREAQMLAALNHPNIAAIHGFEDANGRHALVLELVDGPTLAERIAQGRIPIDEALPIARQIVDALEAAHEQGIIHRDLKPANIKLRHDGTVKVLDFGLAKALSRNEENAASRVDVTASPTMLSPATMTSAGIILGTAAYMAPEQARGRAVDRRADVWAFGCVLYEMLTGRRAFEGDEVTDTLAAILRGEPSWTALPASTPRALQRLLRRCLQKDPRQRLQAIGDARIEIVDALADPEDAAVVATRVGRRAWWPILAASAAAAALATGATWTFKPAPAAVDRSVTRAILAIQPFDQRPLKPGEARSGVMRTSRTAVALSPDGRLLAFRAMSANVGWQLYLRPLDSLTATPIRGTSEGDSPFFSPDGRWIGYTDGRELRRVPATGEDVSYTPIAPLPRGENRIWGASWGDDDHIVFSTAEALWRVPAAGGVPQQIAKPGDGEFIRVLPQLLPGARSLLFTVQKSVSRWDDAQIVVRSLATGDERVLLSDAMDARYAPSGHLVFMRRGRLMAVPFDPERLQVTGAAVAVADDVMQSINVGNTAEETGAGQFAFAAQGTLVYVTGGLPPDDTRELLWVRRDGNVEVVPAPAREYIGPRISPDGQRILAWTSGSDREGGFRLWTYDVMRRTSTPLTSPDDRAVWGVWSPDGMRVGFESVRPGGRGVLSTTRSDGAGKSEAMAVEGPQAPAPVSWSRNGALVFVDAHEKTGTDIWVMDTGSGRARPVVQTPAQERLPALSSDGALLAYNSDEAGRDDVYVQPYPGPGPRVLVSPAGGFAPTWRDDGAELFYYTNTDGVLGMHAVAVSRNGAGVAAGPARLLFTGRYVSSSPGRSYDVTADGQRFVMLRPIERPTAAPAVMTLVTNWFEELKRIAPPR
jgi:eukaryotic-like serine/threonine-protein kinase